MDTDKTEPACFSIHWDISAPECARCFIRKECERTLKRRESGESLVEPPEAEETVTEPEEIAAVDPLEHFLHGLAGKYDRQDRIGDNAVGHYFEEDSKTKVLVTVSKASGRIRVQSKDFERIFDSIESVEAAEELLAAILG